MWESVESDNERRARGVRTTAGLGQSSPMYSVLNFFFCKVIPKDVSIIKAVLSREPSGKLEQREQRKTKGSEKRGS